MIKNIVFDIGGVLINFRTRYVMRECLHFDAETTEAVYKAVIQNPLWSELDRGLLPKEDVIAQMKKSTLEKYQPAIDTFFGTAQEQLSVSFDYSARWLKSLKERGYNIFLLSNYPKDLFELHCKTSFTFLGYTDGHIVSAYLKHIKPEPEIYKALFDTYHLVPAECVFMDDLEKNVEGARAMGMHAIHFTTFDQTRQALETLLLQHTA